MEYSDFNNKRVNPRTAPVETHGCILSTVATDVLVLTHQAISNHSADQISTALDQFQTEMLYL